MHIFALDHSLCVGTLVHDIDFGYHTDRSDALWVHFSGNLQTIWSSHICVGWNRDEHDSSWIGHVSHGHSSSNRLNIIRLVRASHWNPGDTWQVYQSQVWTRVWVDSEYDRLIDDVFTLTTDLVCQEVDCLLHFWEISELLVCYLFEFGPGSRAVRLMVESQLERSSSDYTITSGQEIESHDILKHTRFTCRLTS